MFPGLEFCGWGRLGCITVVAGIQIRPGNSSLHIIFPNFCVLEFDLVETLRMEDPEYRVFVRIPIARPSGFVDPPSFVWNAEKERALWKVISRARRGDINCT